MITCPLSVTLLFLPCYSVNIWLIVKSIEFFSIPSIDQDFGMQIELIKVQNLLLLTNAIT